MLQDHSLTQENSVTEDWVEVLDGYGVQFLVLDVHSDSELVELFQSQHRWTVDFQDGEAVIFARTEIA
jgi:hypothetical protein